MSTPREPCNRPWCRCTHTSGCDRGWLERPPEERNGVTYERVAPCPVCRPELVIRLKEGKHRR